MIDPASAVRIVEVGPRDGLQNEKTPVSIADRIVFIGLAGRFITSAIAGAALAPRRQRWLVGGSTAVVASYPGWRARMASMKHYGQTSTGLVEDAIVLVGAVAILRALGKSTAA